MKAMTQKAVIGAMALVVGMVLGTQLGGSDERKEPMHQVVEGRAAVWTCSMHLQIRMSKPSQCPICAMDLIPVPTSDTAEELGLRQLRLSSDAREQASIQTAPVERRRPGQDLLRAVAVAGAPRLGSPRDRYYF